MHRKRVRILLDSVLIVRLLADRTDLPRREGLGRVVSDKVHESADGVSLRQRALCQGGRYDERRRPLGL